jgi:hypothetical protein
VPYGDRMLHIAIISTEKHWANQLASIFAERELHIEQLETPSRVMLGTNLHWDALVVDLDAVESHTADHEAFLEIAISRARQVIVLVPPRLAPLEPGLAGIGLYVLRKPTSSGEIAIGLQMLFKQ